MSNSGCALCWNALVLLKFLEKNFLFLISFNLEIEIREERKLLEFWLNNFFFFFNICKDLVRESMLKGILEEDIDRDNMKVWKRKIIKKLQMLGL